MALLFLVVFTSCTKNPSNNRTQLTIVPDPVINHLSNTYYFQFLQENRISIDKELNNKIREIGKKIESGIKKYFEYKSQSKLYDKFAFNYDIAIVKDKRILNAFALPTGKIVFYSRILDFTDNEDMIAAIMAHEMAHVVALHSQERMSHALAIETLSTVISGIPGTGSLFSEIGYFLPFSRFQEKEADELGLIFMCFAGYNPENTILFWKKIYKYYEDLKKYKSNNDLIASFKRSAPEILRTHPLTEKRIKNLEVLLESTKEICK